MTDNSRFEGWKNFQKAEIQTELNTVNAKIGELNQQISRETDDKRRQSIEASLNLALAAKTTLEIKLSTL